METNKTITEDYVSFEIAKLLKEKGFNVPVRTFYNPKYRGEKVSDGTALINYNADPEDGSVLCSAPTVQMARKFINKVKGICNFITADDDGKYYFWVAYKKPSYVKRRSEKVFDSYEECADDLVKYCLTKFD
jgi:hypothetical protein